MQYLSYSVAAARFTVLRVCVVFGSEIRRSPIATNQVKPSGEFSRDFHIHHWAAIHHHPNWVHQKERSLPTRET